MWTNSNEINADGRDTLLVAVEAFWVYNQEDEARAIMLPLSHFDTQEKQAQLDS